MATEQGFRFDRWTQAIEWPLTGAALLFLGAYAWPILDVDLPARILALCQAVTWATWALFVLDYGVRLYLAQHRRAFVADNVFDLLVVALPLLRPLRLLRLVTLLAVLNRLAGHSLRGHLVTYAVGATSLLVFVAALATLDAERNGEDANITTFSDALWWATTTITTVGYGDRFPVTAPGRALAAGLMIAGIALLGVVTATLASWLIERIAAAEEAEQAATREQVARLTELVEELVAQRESRSSTPD
jgi:voltage-gated potassium channel